MNKPTLDELLTKVNSKYTLVVIASKRARSFIANPEYTEKDFKPVSKALFEVVEGKLEYKTFDSDSN